MNDVAADGNVRHGPGHMRPLSNISIAVTVDNTSDRNNGSGAINAGGRTSRHDNDNDSRREGGSQLLQDYGKTDNYDDSELFRNGYPRYQEPRERGDNPNGSGIDKYFFKPLDSGELSSTSSTTSSQQGRLSSNEEITQRDIQRAIISLAGQTHWLYRNFNSNNLQVVSEAIETGSLDRVNDIARQLSNNLKASKTVWAIIALDKTHVQLSHICSYKKSNYFCRYLLFFKTIVKYALLFLYLCIYSCQVWLDPRSYI